MARSATIRVTAATALAQWTYDLAGHGVSAGEVRERFGAYGERFGV